MYKNPISYHNMNKYSNSPQYCPNLVPVRDERPHYPCNQPLVERYNPFDCAQYTDEASCVMDTLTNTYPRQGTCATCPDSNTPGLRTAPIDFSNTIDTPTEIEACDAGPRTMYDCEWVPTSSKGPYCGCAPLIEEGYRRY